MDADGGYGVSGTRVLSGAGDGARYDDGDIWILGRVDDVMNVSGHRISTAEVGSALVSHPAVAEAAVAGTADPATGQAVLAFVVLRGTATAAAGDDIMTALRIRSHGSHMGETVRR